MKCEHKDVHPTHRGQKSFFELSFTHFQKSDYPCPFSESSPRLVQPQCSFLASVCLCLVFPCHSCPLPRFDLTIFLFRVVPQNWKIPTRLKWDQLGRTTPAHRMPNSTETWRTRESSTEENSKSQVETAPQNCRFLSLVVVWQMFTCTGISSQSLSCNATPGEESYDF